jgi:hypothetical protein
MREASKGKLTRNKERLKEKKNGDSAISHAKYGKK